MHFWGEGEGSSSCVVLAGRPTQKRLANLLLYNFQQHRSSPRSCRLFQTTLLIGLQVRRRIFSTKLLYDSERNPAPIGLHVGVRFRLLSL